MHFIVLMNYLVVDCLSLLLLLQFVIIARVMKTYLDGTGYNTYGTGNQYPEVGYWILRGDTKL